MDYIDRIKKLKSEKRMTTEEVYKIICRDLYVDAYAYGCCHGFEDEIYVTSVGMLGRVAHSTQLHLSRT